MIIKKEGETEMLQDVVISNKACAKITIDETQLDSIAVKVIKQDTPDFLVPMKMLTIDGEFEVRYDLSSGMRMNYLPERMTKQEFLILLESLVKPFVICNDWFLDYHSFYLDWSYITVGDNYSNVKYSYIPNHNYKNSDVVIVEFFKNFILNMNLSDDPMFIMELFRRLNDKNASFFTIREYIANEKKQVKEQPKSSYIPKESEVSEPKVSEPKVSEPKVTKGWGEVLSHKEEKVEEPKKTTEPSNPVFGQQDVQGNLIQNLFGEEESKKKEEQPKKKSGFSSKLLGSFLGGKKSGTENEPVPATAQKPKKSFGTSPIQQTPFETQSPVSNRMSMNPEDITDITDTPDTNVGNTWVLCLEDSAGYQVPQYIELDLKTGHATIGRYDKAGSPRADYNFDASLSFISKRHLRIEKNGEMFQIIDLAAEKNGTLLNGKVLAANMAYPVVTGDTITFSKKHRITYRVC